jgi:hypothetical protein
VVHDLVYDSKGHPYNVEEKKRSIGNYYSSVKVAKRKCFKSDEVLAQIETQARETVAGKGLGILFSPYSKFYIYDATEKLFVKATKNHLEANKTMIFAFGSEGPDGKLVIYTERKALVAQLTNDVRDVIVEVRENCNAKTEKSEKGYQKLLTTVWKGSEVTLQHLLRLVTSVTHGKRGIASAGSSTSSSNAPECLFVGIPGRLGLTKYDTANADNVALFQAKYRYSKVKKLSVCFGRDVDPVIPDVNLMQKNINDSLEEMYNTPNHYLYHNITLQHKQVLVNYFVMKKNFKKLQSFKEGTGKIVAIKWGFGAFKHLIKPEVDHNGHSVKAFPPVDGKMPDLTTLSTPKPVKNVVTVKIEKPNSMTELLARIASLDEAFHAGNIPETLYLKLKEKNLSDLNKLC